MITLETEINETIATIWLNRPEVQNAMNPTMFAELIYTLKKLAKNKDVRVVVLRGRGKSFCAGADLAWMTESGQASYHQNLAESKLLAKCFHQIYIHPTPVVAIAHGSVFGGGCGLTSVADFVLAVDNSTFCFSEVRLGLAASTIMPYVLQRIGSRYARQFMFTAKRVSADEAVRCGLADEVVTELNLDVQLQILLSDLLQAGPEALTECKRLIRVLDGKPIGKQTLKKTTKAIAQLKAGKESQERIQLFLERK